MIDVIVKSVKFNNMLFFYKDIATMNFQKSLPISLLGLMLAAPAAAEQVDELVKQSRQTVKEFATQLKSELQAAMKAGGPTNAISVCHSVAPAIAKQQSLEFGGEVGRTSLKYRNPDNAPEGWERTVLQKFDEQRAAGKSPKGLEYHEVVEVGGRKTFRYMKAIPTAGVCLNCHGQNIKPPVAERLDALYPQDKARGYTEGEIRGAFTIEKPL